MCRLSRWISVALLLGTPFFAQQASETRPDELVKAKLVYIAPMPNNLDQWISEDLRIWGKYKRTANPEGVDLVVEALAPEESPEFRMRGGIPRPRGKKGGGHSPDQ